MFDAHDPAATIRTIEPARPPRPNLREAAKLADLAGSPLAWMPWPEATPWDRLLRGERGVVDLFETATRRYLLLRRIPRHARAARALSDREREVVERVAAGDSNKCIAIELGVASSTVSTHISRALAKLGLSARIDLVRAAASAAAGDEPSTALRLRLSPLQVGALRCEVAAFDVPPSGDAVRLTPSEADVRDAILRGESNVQIAQARRSSVRTVANQVACVFRKWGVNSRCELAAVMAGA